MMCSSNKIFTGNFDHFAKNQGLNRSLLKFLTEATLCKINQTTVTREKTYEKNFLNQSNRFLDLDKSGEHWGTDQADQAVQNLKIWDKISFRVKKLPKNH